MSSLPEPTGERRAALPPVRRDGQPPAPSQPQRVSVDEMLTQLRSPDGSKRRRRSEQPVYKKRRKQRLWFGILVSTTVVVVAGLYGFRLFQRYRLEGETFREGVNRRISSVLGCDVDFTRIHDGGAGSLAAKEAEIATRGSDLIESAKLSDVSASLTSRSWISNEWGITTLSIGTGTIKLNPARPPAAAGAAEMPVAAETSDETRMTISPEPRLITIDGVRVLGGLTIEWPGAGGGKATENIRKLVGGTKVRSGGVMDGSFINGEMNLTGLAPMTLNQLTWKLTGRHLDIPGGRVTAGPGVQMEIAGKAELVPDGSVTLSVDIVDTQLAALLPSWGEKISGSLEAKNCAFQASFGKGPERTFSGDFTVKGALLRNMGFLGKLGLFIERSDFQVALEFSALTGHFSWSPSGGLVLTNLAAQKDSFLRLAGEATVSNSGSLQGKLRVSVTEAKMNERGQKVDHPFQPADAGWLAMGFNISGTSASVDDDIRMEGIKLNFAQPPAPGEQPGNTKPKSPASNDELERQFRDIQQPR